MGIRTEPQLWGPEADDGHCTNASTRVEGKWFRVKNRARIIMMGPPLEYTADVAAILARVPAHTERADYLNDHLNRDVLRMVRARKVLAFESGISYLDRIEAFCGKEMRCPFEDENKSLLISDYGHLSVTGDVYLGRMFRKNGLFSEMLSDGYRKVILGGKSGGEK